MSAVSTGLVRLNRSLSKCSLNFATTVLKSSVNYTVPLCHAAGQG
jgi:hypothetical protein